MVEDIPFVQSVLYQSPYSGCAQFSGFGAQAAAPSPVTAQPGPQGQPGQINLCADRYHKTWKPYGTPVRPPPPQQLRVMAATQQGRFTVQGPSSTGPFTIGRTRGIVWGGEKHFGITPGGPGQNLGLG
jgi:hypothetical protein